MPIGSRIHKELASRGPHEISTHERVVHIYKEVVSDSSITNEEVIKVQDPDNDDLQMLIELDLGTDP